MNFRRNRQDEEPEINLIPMIDVLLVVLIFLMVTTTFVKPSALKVSLPNSKSEQSGSKENTVSIRVNAKGLFALEGNDQPLTDTELRKQLLLRVQKTPDAKNKLTILIEADGNASHQAVVNALDTVAQVGLNRVSIVTQKR
ncbi:MAG: biopolymer transporter ExbD [Burkholderiales bacterium]|jgi:biopolymer transport protein ExbD|nr:biopolymer transporter ExbD [Burkholderiales bacterium]